MKSNQFSSKFNEIELIQSFWNHFQNKNRFSDVAGFPPVLIITDISPLNWQEYRQSLTKRQFISFAQLQFTSSAHRFSPKNPKNQSPIISTDSTNYTHTHTNTHTLTHTQSIEIWAASGTYVSTPRHRLNNWTAPGGGDRHFHAARQG